jgi:hypothetical protein
MYDSDENEEEFEVHFEIDDSEAAGEAPHKRSRKSSSGAKRSSSESDKEEYYVKLKKDTTKVAPFFMQKEEKFPFTQLSDHYGIETTLRVVPKKGSVNTA